ncbi:type II toxin-antitoxin system Phd/YefM family antitoxin [Vibrio sp. Isolate25]|uniref:type II toxin-antitoxin system Phd/YefM family antitoxin n=1 Tax=Vibrio sp. Isolate25 TaxID=2908535 RepID=UPI001EFE1F9C|nr:type II toxin-antitoxin system Phd/YefM family antitoxin [Vibrio sp. Isolate25]MCG9597068.1 type II toxin-antitoxin system Phd/YefM family antitoxin [Vibrio sp. Isolate25]
MEASNTETVSFLKKNAADLPVDEPLVITQNGVPKYVVESYADKKQRDEAIAMMKLTTFAKQDVANQRVSTLGNLKARLSERKNRLNRENNNDGQTG